MHTYIHNQDVVVIVVLVLMVIVVPDDAYSGSYSIS